MSGSERHRGVEAQKGSIFGRRFDHEPHVQGAGLQCNNCHRSHDEREKSEIVSFDSTGCRSCHHQEPEAGCTACHASPGPANALRTSRGDFDHSFHVEGFELDCSDCHAAGEGGGLELLELTCTGCHE